MNARLEAIENIHTVTLIAAWIGVAHVVSGVCIILEPEAILVSAFAGIRWITALYSPGEVMAGWFLIAIGLMAIAAGNRWWPLPPDIRLKLLAPQVVLLVFTLSSVIVAAAEGKYPDGYVPTGGTLFIVADQSMAALVSAFHVGSVLFLPLRAVPLTA